MSRDGSCADLKHDLDPWLVKHTLVIREEVYNLEAPDKNALVCRRRSHHVKGTSGKRRPCDIVNGACMSLELPLCAILNELLAVRCARKPIEQ